MKRIALFALLLLIFPMVAPSSIVLAGPSEKTLIESWEILQKNDPKTLVFEKTAADRYKFKTERFPFDGELKILNVVINDLMAETEYGAISGSVEVELGGVSGEELYKKYQQGYSVWNQNNTLFYDKKTGQWFGMKDFYAKVQRKISPQIWFLSFLGYGWNLIVILFFVFLLISIIKMQKKNKTYLDDARAATKKSLDIGERALALGEDSNKVLKEILETLKKNGER